jgi:hypothetical protein
MQWNPFKSGVVHRQRIGGEFIFEKHLAKDRSRRFRDSVGHLAQWISNFRDRIALRSFRTANDSQRDPPARWSPIFRALAGSVFLDALVVTKRRNAPTSGVGNFYGNEKIVEKTTLLWMCLYVC